MPGFPCLVVSKSGSGMAVVSRHRCMKSARRKARHLASFSLSTSYVAVKVRWSKGSSDYMLGELVDDSAISDSASYPPGFSRGGEKSQDST